ncbi:hypothetical protein JNUCC1_02134 [Lentibacillus sp. JNUCC-1]|uniref:hypothetical protein n=1 Tax=Lentibacillus sp. JNUCC-1 TaxID=2654513 RepID=UPI0012E76EA6|nr:hypothetical protein [Lentibacillus sp. JNUCC-1]MUV38296.1 hypothetical protein [Lentibacillus sp. JNUCC-1]
MQKLIIVTSAALALIFFSQSSTFAETRDIEVFDTVQGKVVFTASPSKQLQQEAGSFLQHLTDVYRDVSPLPNEGYMIRVPLNPPVEVNNQWIHELIDEVVILYSTEDNPYLLVFDQENQARFFTFEGDAASFLSHVLQKGQLFSAPRLNANNGQR